MKMPVRRIYNKQNVYGERSYRLLILDSTIKNKLPNTFGMEAILLYSGGGGGHLFILDTLLGPIHVPNEAIQHGSPLSRILSR